MAKSGPGFGHLVDNLPALAAASAAILAGMHGYFTNLSTDTTYRNIAAFLIVFYILGALARSSARAFAKEAAEKEEANSEAKEKEASDEDLIYLDDDADDDADGEADGETESQAENDAGGESGNGAKSAEEAGEDAPGKLSDEGEDGLEVNSAEGYGDGGDGDGGVEGVAAGIGDGGYADGSGASENA